MSLTHWKKLTNPLYLGAYSIEDGQDMVLTIQSVRLEVVTGADGKKEECTVAYFSDSPENKPMILNSTNCKMIAKLLKTPYIENWAGHKIQIGVEKVRAFGETVDALRVRNFLPKATKQIICKVCGKPVIAAHGMTPEQVAKYTASKYGKTMCAECASRTNASESKQQPENEVATS